MATVDWEQIEDGGGDEDDDDDNILRILPSIRVSKTADDDDVDSHTSCGCLFENGPFCSKHAIQQELESHLAWILQVEEFPKLLGEEKEENDNLEEEYVEHSEVQLLWDGQNIATSRSGNENEDGSTTEDEGIDWKTIEPASAVASDMVRPVQHTLPDCRPRGLPAHTRAHSYPSSSGFRTVEPCDIQSNLTRRSSLEPRVGQHPHYFQTKKDEETTASSTYRNTTKLEALFRSRLREGRVVKKDEGQGQQRVTSPVARFREKCSTIQEEQQSPRGVVEPAELSPFFMSMTILEE